MRSGEDNNNKLRPSVCFGPAHTPCSDDFLRWQSSLHHHYQGGSLRLSTSARTQKINRDSAVTSGNMGGWSQEGGESIVNIAHCPRVSITSWWWLWVQLCFVQRVLTRVWGLNRIISGNTIHPATALSVITTGEFNLTPITGLAHQQRGAKSEIGSEIRRMLVRPENEFTPSKKPGSWKSLS